MELAIRKGNDAFVPAGAFRQLSEQLRRHATDLVELPAVVVACHDRRTRLLPFMPYDKYIVPAGARSVAATLHQAGFTRSRMVFQLWNRNFLPSHARLDGRIPQMLLLSTLSLHSAEAFRLIADAWNMGEDRPLIVVGGPKAIYDPYRLWLAPGPRPTAGPDVVVTGESYVLMELLYTVMQYRGRAETLRTAFERARREGALETIAGLVFLAPGATCHDPHLIDTGLQRLVPDLDELPDEVVGLSLLEPPHGGRGLSAQPLAKDQVRRHGRILTMQLTQGCKFHCSYCPIPAVNQKTWRHRSPEAIARQMKSVYDEYRIKFFFGTDDNFFNRRETASQILEALAATTTARGRRLGDCIRWGTEATQFDTYKNRDLLPLARRAGLHAIWLGIEDLTAELIDKGQKPELTEQLFSLMHQCGIAPMAMLMYHDGQPFFTRDSLYGIRNQVQFLRKAGAVAVQCTVHVPAIGTKEADHTYATGKVLSRLGSLAIEDRAFDGNHMIVAGQEPSWRRQIKFIGAYASFYNPVNLFRSLRNDGSPLRKLRVGFQIVGFLGMVLTFVRTLPYLFRLCWCKPEFHQHAPPAYPLPVTLAPGTFPRLPDSSARTSKAA